ncbi:GNAT family N-acetyltransferase [Luethyella okanaganae]|uniref:GNAT family N-acetyltransferase n=1 Tax=Luethyella okanaganae TaxID=69372 RepID=A0ABW1VDG9_9MICO
MSIQVRPLKDGDFFPWLGLFEGYSEFYQSKLTDEKALRVWSWLMDKNQESSGIVAVDGEEFVGFAHLREFSRPLDASRGLFLDDLFVLPDARSQGVGATLIAFAKSLAVERGLSIVRWITAADNETAQRLYDKLATRTEWVTYDLDPRAA